MRDIGQANETIDGQVVTASRLLKEYLFSLPMIQRPYDWPEDEALGLLDELLESVGPSTGRQVSELEQYMLGMITLSESTGSSGIKFNCKLIIDGQQRIITLALILAAAREQLESAADAGNKAAGKVAASLVERLYEEGDEAEDLADQPRIVLKSKADTEFLTNLLTDPGFVQQPGTKVPLEGSSQPKLWANMQAEASNLPIVALRWPPSAQEAFGNKWEEQEKALGREEGLSDVARQLALIFLGRFPTTHSEFDDLDALFKAFAAELTPVAAATAGEVFFEDAYSELQDADLRSSHSGSQQACRDANYLLGVLGRWKKQSEWRAPVLVMLVLFSKRRLSDEALLACLADVERLLVCAVLCKWTPRKRKERWLQVLEDLGCGRGTTYHLLQQRAAPAALPPSLELAAEELAAARAALAGPVYDTYAKDVPRLLLMRLNEFLLRGADASYVTYDDKARTQLTLEHVLPQKMAEGSGWAAAFPPEQHAHWVHRLGNLVLLASRKNAAAGMLPFQDKKKKYFFSGGANVGVDPEVLQQRQEYVLSLALRCWQLHERAPC
ncbi:hypothetical protein CHLNCDRAFT_133929 [Chlorella variabilis]|uniref:DUF262 domain-containing protein n=1 Tax=Chlorella variabilis TaxID=554065 RepID=E1ZEL5_CHLVA|nr:hypothetical protein CHLNCDRAFT_133929 [Chlorella variabilis]EFN55683.1 hypothetical protein CHLNCDRAFT_133929 [Chlorella variabilis]|eukprot:XP_005847785.1 hypothetical protein CHLNCDRAFT_133929 [Chlorella variabilis]